MKPKNTIEILPCFILTLLCHPETICLKQPNLCFLDVVMDDEDEGVITAGAVVTVDVELTRKTLKVSINRL